MSVPSCNGTLLQGCGKPWYRGYGTTRSTTGRSTDNNDCKFNAIIAICTYSPISWGLLQTMKPTSTERSGCWAPPTTFCLSLMLFRRQLILVVNFEWLVSISVQPLMLLITRYSFSNCKINRQHTVLVNEIFSNTRGCWGHSTPTPFSWSWLHSLK